MIVGDFLLVDTRSASVRSLHLEDQRMMYIMNYYVDCSIELHSAAIVHDNDLSVFFLCLNHYDAHLTNSGNGTEQENAQAEKAYEVAATKGYRPCALTLCSIFILR